jgi:hypothetical protein
MVSWGSSGTALLLCLAAACSKSERPITELVLVADTNIANVDSIEFSVTSEEDPTIHQSATRMFDSNTDTSPSFLSVVREEGPLGPLLVKARALSNGTEVLSRTQRVSFVPEQTKVVELHLVETCINVSCPGATCSEDGCVPLQVDALDPWTGAPPSIDDPGPDLDAGSGQDAGAKDAASSDGGGGTGGGGDAGTDAANPPLTYCPLVGWVDLQSDPKHCNACQTECLAALSSTNAVAVCEQGSCGFDCIPDFGNCDGIVTYTNGCERYLKYDPAHCGACNTPCGEGQTCQDSRCVAE